MRPIRVLACSVIIPLLLGISLHIPAANAVSNIDGVWSELGEAESAPDARREYAAVYDRVNQRYIMFAGFTNEQGGGYYLFDEVWVLTLDDNPAWSQLSIPGTVPGGRHSPQWGYDPTRNRLLVFGGYGLHYPSSPYYEYLNDIWELKLDGGEQWNEIAATGTPPAGRLAGAAVYDVLHQRFVGFGGTAGLPVDTWQLDLRDEPAWSTVPTNGVEPPGAYGMTSIFDPVRNRMLIFGGSTSADYYGTHNNTWELDLQPETPQWRQLNPAGTLPAERRSLTSIFDPRRDRMIVFGGGSPSFEQEVFMNDTWALSLSSEDGEWTELAPGGTVPGVRDVMSAVYDPHGDRMVLFGGWSGTQMLGDTQFLTWDDAGEPATVSSSVETDPGVAHVEWNTGNTTGPIGAVYRRQANTEWTSLGTVQADGLGLFQFEDTVAPGQDYGYKILVSSERGEEFIGEVWLSAATGVGDTPRAGLSLQAWPNPAVGPIGVSFALAADGPAQLEMFDVRGRRVLTRDVGALGVGAHRLELGRARDYASGVYFVRLTQSGRSVSSRFVVVR